jgi:phenylalanyl-tRNA synthetase beta chain
VGYLGVLHPDVARSWELREDAVVAEVGLEGVLAEAPAPARFQPLPRFPEVARDLSVICEAGLPSAQIETLVARAGGELLRAVAITDRYQGPPVPAGRVSLTLALRYQHPGRTLTGEEVQASVDAVIQALRAAGFEIRGQ